MAWVFGTCCVLVSMRDADRGRGSRQQGTSVRPSRSEAHRAGAGSPSRASEAKSKPHGRSLPIGLMPPSELKAVFSPGEMF